MQILTYTNLNIYYILFQFCNKIRQKQLHFNQILSFLYGNMKISNIFLRLPFFIKKQGKQQYIIQILILYRNMSNISYRFWNISIYVDFDFFICKYENKHYFIHILNFYIKYYKNSNILFRCWHFYIEIWKLSRFSTECLFYI